MTAVERALPPLPIEAQPYKSIDAGIPGFDHRQWIYRFPNGYGASVIQGSGTYGGPEGFYEVGVVWFDGDEFSLTYETPITNDVIGWQTIADVAALLVKVAAL